MFAGSVKNTWHTSGRQHFCLRGQREAHNMQSDCLAESMHRQGIYHRDGKGRLRGLLGCRLLLVTATETF